MPPLFASKTTFARIAFLRQGKRLADKKGTQNVKFCTENKTKQIRPCTREKETETESRQVYNRQRKRLLGMQLIANGDNIMQTQKLSGIGRWVSAYIEHIKWFPPCHLFEA